MNSKATPKSDPVAPKALDPANAVMGKYYDYYQAGTNFVRIAPDLLDASPDDEAVDKALRGLKEIASRTAKQAS